MTAFLRPGDKIHLTVPGHIEGKTLGELRDDYRKQEVEVFLFTADATDTPIRVVSVIRQEPSFADWLPEMIHEASPNLNPHHPE